MTGFFASCRKARPFAAPAAIFILVDHGNDAVNPVIRKKIKFSPSSLCEVNLIIQKESVKYYIIAIEILLLNS